MLRSMHRVLCSRIARRSTGPLARAASSTMAAQTGLEIKREARKQVKQRLKQLTTADMEQESSAVAKAVIGSPFFKQCSRIGLYVTCEKLREVNTSEILKAALQQGKHCYVPVVLDKDSNMHLLRIDGLEDLHAVPPYGILEPRPNKADGSAREDVLSAEEPLDLLLMPGLAFDSGGRRLGRGGGYYDKFLSSLSARAQEKGWRPPLLVALAFQVQLLDDVPVDDHDQHVDVVGSNFKKRAIPADFIVFRNVPERMLARITGT